jgi:hypothetical protein
MRAGIAPLTERAEIIERTHPTLAPAGGGSSRSPLAGIIELTGAGVWISIAIRIHNTEVCYENRPDDP